MASVPAASDSTGVQPPTDFSALSSTTSSNPVAAPPTSPVSDKPADESSKLKTLLGILRKFIGVADIAAVRFSLPAQLLEPTPNLEYWHYLDRPDTFISIGQSDDEVERMLEVLRFWFTKDLKYIKGKPCKPYNSALGEFFRCNWDVADVDPSVSAPLGLGEARSSGDDGKTSLSGPMQSSEPVRVSYINEQTSHHPPVSAYYIDCPARGIYARGYDQLSAKFTGTAIKVIPGTYNRGIFITLKRRDNEEYQLTHPAAQLGGLLRGALAVSVADTCFVTCPRTRLKVILQYMEEGWLGKSQNKIQGIIFRYDPDDDRYTRIKEVPSKDIIVNINGSWQDQIYYTFASKSSSGKLGLGRSGHHNKSSSNGDDSDGKLLVDVTPLLPLPKVVPPEDDQLPNESRRYWKDVTNAIVGKQYGEATRLKQLLEQNQRDKVEDRKTKNEEWKPRFFQHALSPEARPELNDEGRMALDRLQHGDYRLEEG